MKLKTKPILLLLVFLTLGLTTPGTPQQKNTKAARTVADNDNKDIESVPLPDPLLVNVNYIRLRCVFNGVAFYKGFTHPRDMEIREFNLDAVFTRMAEDEIPYGKDDIRAVYARVEALLKKSEIRLLDIFPKQEDLNATIIPSLDIDFSIRPEIMPNAAGQDSNDAKPANTSETNTRSETKVGPASKYIVLASINLVRLMSTWNGNENVQVQVIGWRLVDFFTVNADVLVETLGEKADQLTSAFVARLLESNPQPVKADTAAEEIKKSTDLKQK